jgi:hypothetical protein
MYSHFEMGQYIVVSHISLLRQIHPAFEADRKFCLVNHTNHFLHEEAYECQVLTHLEKMSHTKNSTHSCICVLHHFEKYKSSCEGRVEAIIIHESFVNGYRPRQVPNILYTDECRGQDLLEVSGYPDLQELNAKSSPT